jgi:2-methylcitrate dehydratase PrpD
VRAQALLLLVDHLAVARRGATAPSAVAAREGLTAAASALSPAEVALLNGIAGHAIELDDTHEASSTHPGTCVWPAVLAMADARGSSLAEILDAGVVGYDHMCALGEDLGPNAVYARGFHPTGVTGPIGAAAAVAHLLGLDAEGVERAVLLAMSTSSGLLTFLDGTGSTKPLQAGHAAAAGLHAALLSAAGYEAPERTRAFARFAETFGQEPPADPVERQAGHGVMGTSIKLYPCCRYLHGCIDLLLDLQHPLDEIARVECAVLPGGWSLVALPTDLKRRPTGVVEAQFSMPFAAATALSAGRFTLAEVEGVATLGDDMRALMDLVTCVRDPRLDREYPARWGAAVWIITRSGDIVTRRAEAFLGSPARPAPADVVRAKLAGLVGEDWADASERLTQAPDAHGLTALRA